MLDLCPCPTTLPMIINLIVSYKPHHMTHQMNCSPWSGSTPLITQTCFQSTRPTQSLTLCIIYLVLALLQVFFYLFLIKPCICIQTHESDIYIRWLSLWGTTTTVWHHLHRIKWTMLPSSAAILHLCHSQASNQASAILLSSRNTTEIQRNTEVSSCSACFISFHSATSMTRKLFSWYPSLWVSVAYSGVVD